MNPLSSIRTPIMLSALCIACGEEAERQPRHDREQRPQCAQSHEPESDVNAGPEPLSMLARADEDA